MWNFTGVAGVWFPPRLAGHVSTDTVSLGSRPASSGRANNTALCPKRFAQRTLAIEARKLRFELDQQIDHRLEIAGALALGTDRGPNLSGIGVRRCRDRQREPGVGAVRLEPAPPQPGDAFHRRLQAAGCPDLPRRRGSPSRCSTRPSTTGRSAPCAGCSWPSAPRPTASMGRRPRRPSSAR
jgi:hypothetical protein